jgi:group I intron endonuclease
MSTYSIEKRWALHRWYLRKGTHSNIHLQNAWNKDGEENFEFGILEELIDKNEIKEREIYYISSFNSHYNGYNLTNGGDGCNGMVLSEHTKLLIGLKNKINMTGKKHSNKTKDKMSKVHKGYIKTDEHRKHLSESLTGIIRSEETKEKCRIANQGDKQPTSKYSEALIREIKLNFKNGATSKELSDFYNIPKGTLNGIKYGLRWKHIEV